MLAIPYIGGVYVSLDVSLPASCHSDTLSSCKTMLMLCHEQMEEQVRDLLELFEEVRVVQMESHAYGIDCDDQGTYPLILVKSAQTRLLSCFSQVAQPVHRRMYS